MEGRAAREGLGVVIGVFKPVDSPYFWLWLDGHNDARGRPLREKTDVRADAPTPVLRKENRALAERRFHERMTQLATEGVAGAKPQITFKTFVAWWQKTALPLRRGREREAYALPRLVTAFGDMAITAVDRHAVQEWIAERLTTQTTIGTSARAYQVQAGPSTVNREVDVLKAILQAAVPKYLAVSPLYGMKRLVTTTPKRRLMTEEEERKLLAVMAPDDRALFLLALDGLVRLTDCLDVKRSDDHGDTIWIADPKAGGGLHVPVSRRLREALDAMPERAYSGRKLTGAQVAAIRAMLATGPTQSKAALARHFGVSETMVRKLARAPESQPSAFLFARRRIAKTERDRRGTIRQMLERYCRLADVPYGRAVGGLTFHWSTRRTGATRMLTRGVDPGTVQKVGGWKDATIVLDIYHELIDERARAAVEAVSQPESSQSGEKQNLKKPNKTKHSIKRRSGGPGRGRR